MTSPKLYSPVAVHTFESYPTLEQIQQYGQPHVDKNRDWSLLVHFDEQPQLHVVPIHIPLTQLHLNTNQSKNKIPLLPAPPKVPYLA